MLDYFEPSLLVYLVFCGFSFRITSHRGVLIRILAGFAGTRRWLRVSFCSTSRAIVERLAGSVSSGVRHLLGSCFPRYHLFLDL